MEKNVQRRKKERRYFKECISRISEKSKVQEEYRSEVLPQKVSQDETVTSELTQKVKQNQKKISSVLPQKVEISQRPSNTIEKVNFEVQKNDIKFNYDTHTSNNDNNIIKQNNLMPPPTCYPPPLNITPQINFIHSSNEAIAAVEPQSYPTFPEEFVIDSLALEETSEDTQTDESTLVKEDTNLDEKFYDQSPSPLQINTLQNEQSTFLQPLLEVKIEENPSPEFLELYSSNNISLENNEVSLELFNFILPIHQPSTQLGDKETFENDAKCFTFDEMADFLVIITLSP
jgi:hypothetical protein